MKGQNSNDRFTGTMFRRQWGPCLISSIGLAFGDIADAVVVGQRMGAVGLAAISLCLPVYMVINVCMHSLGLGGSVKYSKYLGGGKREEAVHNFNVILQAALVLGIALAIAGNCLLEPVLAVLGTRPGDGELFLAGREYAGIIIMGIPAFFISYLLNYYLRNDGKQRLAVLGFTIANISDILLNILFVLVLDMGAAGAALSTVAGQLLAIAIYLPDILGRKDVLAFAWCAPDVREVCACFKTGFSTSVQYICQLAFLLVCNNVLMQSAGEEGVAVFDMLQNASYLILYLYEGTVKAMQPLVSTYCGERNEEGKGNTFWLGLWYGGITGLSVILLICLFPGFLCRLFGLKEVAVAAMGSRALRIYSMGAFFGGINIVLEGYYQACEMEKNAFRLAVLRSAAVLLPYTALFSFLGLKWFWWLFPFTEISSLLLFLLWLKRWGQKGSGYEPERVFSRTIENKNDDLMALTQAAEQFCHKWKADRKQTYFVTMAVEEICLVIMEKAFQQRQRGFIQLTLIALEDSCFELHIRDNAASFNPFSLNTNKWNQRGDYDLDAMGMLVIKQKAREFFYRQYQGFNSLVVKV